MWRKKAKTPRDYFDEYSKLFLSYTDQQLVDAFNGQVQLLAWNIARSAYLWALQNSFDVRGIDYSIIGNPSNVSYANYVHLIGMKLYLVKDLPVSELQTLLDEWARLCRPGIVKDKPQVVKVYEVDQFNSHPSLHVRSAIPGYGIQMSLPIRDVMNCIIKHRKTETHGNK